MKLRWWGTAMAVTLLSAGAEAGSGAGLAQCYLVPSAAHIPGALGTFWRTDLFVLNPLRHRSATVQVWFFPELTDNGSAQPRTFSIPAGRQLRLDDVVRTVFSATTKGSLLVCGTDAHTALAVAARTYTGTNGTYGQAIQGQRSVNRAGETALIPGVRNAHPYRANLGVASSANLQQRLRAEVYNATGILLGSRTFLLLPYSSEQVPLSNFAGTFESGYVRLVSEPATAAGGWVAYVSVVDNLTGDAVYLEERWDDRFTDRRPSCNLTGQWSGMLASPDFTQSVTAHVYQYGALLRVYLYDTPTGGRVAYLEGYEEERRINLSGRSDVLQYLGAELWVMGQLNTSGTSVMGSFTGTGPYARGGVFSLSSSAPRCQGTQEEPAPLGEPAVPTAGRKAPVGCPGCPVPQEDGGVDGGAR